MDQIEQFLQEYFFLIAWAIVILLALVFGVPFWVLNFKMLKQYRRKEFYACLNTAIEVYRKAIGSRFRTNLLSYVLSCALAINKKDIFEANIQKIHSTKPWHLGIKLIWETIYQLDQGNIENAKRTYQQFCSLNDQRVPVFSKSISEVLAYYDGKISFSKEAIQEKMDKAAHPALFRIYSKINENIR